MRIPLLQQIPLIKIVKGVGKVANDFSLIFYDDLDHVAMSLPRVFGGLFSIILIYSYLAEQFWHYESPHFEAMATVTGAIWSTYAFKKWTTCKCGGKESENNAGQPSE